MQSEQQGQKRFKFQGGKFEEDYKPEVTLSILEVLDLAGEGVLEICIADNRFRPLPIAIKEKIFFHHVFQPTKTYGEAENRLGWVLAMISSKFMVDLRVKSMRETGTELIFFFCQ